MKVINALLITTALMFGCQTVADKSNTENPEAVNSDWIKTGLETNSPIVSSAALDWVLTQGNQQQLEQFMSQDLSNLKTSTGAYTDTYLPTMNDSWQLLKADTLSADIAHLYYRTRGDDFFWIRFDLSPDSQGHWRIDDIQNFDNGLSYQQWLRQLKTVNTILNKSSKSRSKSNLTLKEAAILAMNSPDTLKYLGLDPEMAIFVDVKTIDVSHPLTKPSQATYQRQIDKNTDKILPLQEYFLSLNTKDLSMIKQKQQQFANMTGDFWWPVYFYGRYMQAIGNQSEAQRLFRQAIIIDPVIDSSYFTLLESYVAGKQYSEAITVINYLDELDYIMDQEYFSDPIYHDFILSPEFIAWQKSQKS
ncbi:hypothetical protein [Gynuella sunshinyii]|uniref:Uncharacterized protein n=1 Tax=Gynuella sunshinyii YC6258 TaxID=1445510 RepID=A0A0C5VRY5_9GAMM|nr:hypothetical protein [Gynuella sunshinyii]AJQ97407.1 hypothetical Protein YC6258_05377 [Gynuella sunshinyii YC6258]